MLVKDVKLDLKKSSQVTEDMIQEFIFKDPSVLGLGELTAVRREKIQPLGGRLDLLLYDDSNNMRYEVEIQLGETDPSHIIRTIEYWDTEKKRYPQYEHCAVIVAEKITGRFMNVISLFNGAIPLIALQLSATLRGDDVGIRFDKIVDRVTYGSDAEEEYEVTDRNYWETRSTSKMLKNIDEIFESLKGLVGGYELKYNKYYIGVAKNGIAKNFIHFVPRKGILYFKIKGEEDAELMSKAKENGLEISYVLRRKQYEIMLNGFEDYKKNKDIIDEFVKQSMDYYNVEE